MKVIICVDDHLGYMFNNRRLSSDRMQRLHMLSKIASIGSNLFINQYSERSFRRMKLLGAYRTIDNVKVINGEASEFLVSADENDGWAFVENVDVAKWVDKADELIIYKWNRTYPYDKKLSDDIFDKFDVAENELFKGNSHPTIEYVYMRKKSDK